jgi:hypothetical protein
MVADRPLFFGFLGLQVKLAAATADPSGACSLSCAVIFFSWAPSILGGELRIEGLGLGVEA